MPMWVFQVRLLPSMSFLDDLPLRPLLDAEAPHAPAHCGGLGPDLPGDAFLRPEPPAEPDDTLPPALRPDAAGRPSDERILSRPPSPG